MPPMPPTDTLLLAALAFAFAVVNGVNDGSTLVATGLRVSALRPLGAIALLVVALAAVPPLLGTAVATTLANRLVDFRGPAAEAALASAVASATLVSWGLARAGLPTSLTLSLMGGIAGAGVGAGLPVAWGTVALVLAVAAVAPFAGGVLAFVLSGLPVRLPRGIAPQRLVGHAHRLAFGLQCLSYGANDGQKMLAVFAVLTAASIPGQAVPTPAPMLAAIAAGFLAGVVAGLPKVAATIARGVTIARPYHAVVAEASSAAAVLGSAALGVPVSMTQALAGGLVGVGSRAGIGRVRWQVVVRLAAAWVVTLPSAGLVAGVGALLAVRLLPG
jgi:inorganic phosphate transporter, PiT family